MKPTATTRERSAGRSVPPGRRIDPNAALAALIAAWGLLLAEASRLAEEERALAESRDLAGGAGTQSAEIASDVTGQEVAEALERHVRGQLFEVEQALRRLDTGWYGRCEGCGEPIDLARLRVRPWARYCLTCRLRSEAGSGWQMGASSERRRTHARHAS